MGYAGAGLLNILWLYCWTWIGKLVGFAVLRAFGVQDLERYYFPFALGALLYALYFILRTIAEEYDGTIDQPRPPNPFRHFWRSHLRPAASPRKPEQPQAPGPASASAASDPPHSPEAVTEPKAKAHRKPESWHPFSPK
jgi:hypothetical protein